MYKDSYTASDHSLSFLVLVPAEIEVHVGVRMGKVMSIFVAKFNGRLVVMGGKL